MSTGRHPNLSGGTGMCLPHSLSPFIYSEDKDQRTLLCVHWPAPTLWWTGLSSSTDLMLVMIDTGRSADKFPPQHSNHKLWLISVFWRAGPTHSLSSFLSHFFPFMNRLFLRHTYCSLCPAASLYLSTFLSASSQFVKRVQKKRGKGRKESRKQKEGLILLTALPSALLQMDIHLVQMQSSAIPSWCSNTNLAWSRQEENRFKESHKRWDKWRKKMETLARSS